MDRRAVTSRMAPVQRTSAPEASRVAMPVAWIQRVAPPHRIPISRSKRADLPAKCAVTPSCHLARSPGANGKRERKSALLANTVSCGKPHISSMRGEAWKSSVATSQSQKPSSLAFIAIA